MIPWTALQTTTTTTTLLLFVLLAAAAISPSSAAADDGPKGLPPPFFLQDPSDNLCFGGEEFKRCSVDTLFYVTGSAGNYQIHKRPVDLSYSSDEEARALEADMNDGICFAKKSCGEKDHGTAEPAKLTKCSHCGAKGWNILGDSDSGYVLTFQDGKSCLVREKDSVGAVTAPCESEEYPYSPLQLQFVSSADVTAMSSPAARLIGAATDGDLRAVQELLSKDKTKEDGGGGGGGMTIDVNVRDWDDMTALIPAASSGHVDICRYLLKEGADPNAKDKDGITALMEASIMGRMEVVELLLEHGAELDATANSHVSALWLASGEGRVDVMRLLLDRGADATNTRIDGISALMTASVGGHDDAVRLLLEHGADPTTADNEELTALMNAAESGNVELMRLLVEAAKEPKAYMDVVTTGSGLSALIVASAHGKKEAVEYLLDAGANVNLLHDSGVTPLMYAVASNHTDVVRLLLEKGKVDINAQHTNGGTAFLEACSSGAVEAMEVLLENGASFDAVDVDGVTPLMAIASHGSLEGQTLLLNALEKSRSKEEVLQHINLAAYSGGTAVMFAASQGHPKCTKQLIEHGANVNDIARALPEYLKKLEKMQEEGTAPDDEPHVDGVTALHVAAQGGHLETVKLLLESGADVTVLDDEKRSALVLAVKGNYAETALVLLKAGSDPNTPFVDEDGATHNLLMDAITVENEDFAASLIERGAELYFKDATGVTTLLQASHRGLTNIVKLLLEKHDAGKNGSYLDDASEEGVTPVIGAASEGHTEIVKLLASAGADVNAKDKDGTTALMAAGARGHLEAVRALLDAGANVNDQNMDGHTALMFAYNGKNQVETLWERYSQFVAESESPEEADDGGTGPMIRDALSNHTALVDLLLKSGADASLKDKEGHTAKDFDFHPDADAEVLAKEMKAKSKRDEGTNEL